METISDIEFQVNQQYENEKGTFTVVSIQGDRMVIRWSDGEEVRTGIDLQQRIQARRRWERVRRESAADDRQSPPAGVPSDAKGFDGLQDGDFKESAYRTKWRGRDQLGGAVSRRLSAEGLRINSWAVAQTSAVRWQDTRHRQRGGGNDTQAAFFVRLDTQTLRYGLAVVRPEAGSTAAADWDAFVAWLTRPENETVLHTLCIGHDLGVVLSTRSASVGVYPQDTGGWRIEGNGKQRVMKTLAATVDALPPEGRIDVEIAAQIDRPDAVAHGRDIAGEIADQFTHLLPVYRAVLP